MMEVVNTLSLKNKHVVISFCIAEISAKENRYQYLNFKADKPISDNLTDHRYITSMYVHVSDTYSCYYVCM